MVTRLLARVRQPVRGLHQAAYLLAALTLASQALALLRDRTFAHTFGAGHTLDLYYAAFRVPDLVFALVSSLVSAYVLIPRITGVSRFETERLLSECATFLLVAGGGLCIIIALFMPQFLALLYPSLAVGDTGSFVFLARLLLAQPIILGLSGVIASVTQVNRRFLLFALSPVLYNLGIIFGTVALYPLWGLSGIGVGVVVGAVLYGAVNIPVLLEAKVYPHFAMPTWAVMLPVVRDSVPRSLALGMGSVTVLALTALASRLGTGAVSVFTFAGNLEAVPLALIGSSYAVAAFPALSAALQSDEKEEFGRILSASSRHIALWSLVALGFIIVLRAYIVRVVLGTGAFDWDATRLTAALLAVLAVGLVAQGLVLLYSRALYAARQSWRPLAYQVAGAAITIGLALVLLAPATRPLAAWLASLMRLAGVPGASVLLIALASSLGQIALLVLSLLALGRLAPGLARAVLRPVAQGAAAACTGGLVAYGALTLLGGIEPLTTLATVLLHGAAAGLIGLATAAAALRVMRNEEFADLAGALGRLVHARQPAEVLAPSAEEPVQP